MNRNLLAITGLIGFVFFLPFSFVGLDYTDQGFHFYNQIHSKSFYDTIVLCRLSWFPDYLSAHLVRLFNVESFWSWRVLGVIVWSLNLCLFSVFINQASELIFKRTLNLRDQILVLFPIFLFAIKTVPAGMLMTPDYYSLPILFSFFSLVLLLKVYKHPSLSYLALLSVCLITLFNLRPSLAGYALIVTTSVFAFRLPNRWLFTLITIAGIAAGAFFFAHVIKPLLPYEFSGRHDIASLLSSHLNDLVLFTKSSLTTILLSLLGAYFLNRSKTDISFAKAFAFSLYLLASIAFFLQGVGNSFQSTKVLMIFIVEFLIASTAALWPLIKARHKETVWILLSILSLSYCLGFGSDAGLLKMKYGLAGFFALGVLALLSEVKSKVLSKTLYAVLPFVAFIHFYANIYRDDLRETLRSPTLIQGLEKLGPIITTPLNAEILKDFQELDRQYSDRFRFYGPNAPLLNALAQQNSLFPSWLEVLPQESQDENMKDFCSKNGVLIYSKRPLTYPLPAKWSPPNMSEVVEKFKDHPFSALKETQYFQVFECRVR